MILYQLLMALALPVLLAHQAAFGAKGSVAERMGHGVAPRPGPGGRLWLHAASVGEVTSAAWVVAALIAARPGLQVLVTTNTATGRDRVRGWKLPGVMAALAPFDSAGAAARVMDRWRPHALVIVENELWPARLRAADNRGVPVLVIGARMSARSARRWGRLLGLIRPMLAQIDWLSAQDGDSLSRLLALGLRPEAAGPVMALKSLGQAGATALPFPAPAPRDVTLLAASTHEGEEALVLDAFQSAGRFQHLILAPRHPRRGDEVAALLAARGLRHARRSTAEVPGPDTQVYLADTLGEMDLWYAMAGVTVIGGSFAPKGGHTPWEPARAGSAIVHGPSLHNFAAPFAALDAAGGAVAVPDVVGLSRALQELDAAAQARLTRNATQVLKPPTDGAEVIDGILRELKA